MQVKSSDANKNLGNIDYILEHKDDSVSLASNKGLTLLQFAILNNLRKGKLANVKEILDKFSANDTLKKDLQKAISIPFAEGKYEGNTIAGILVEEDKDKALMLLLSQDKSKNLGVIDSLKNLVYPSSSTEQGHTPLTYAAKTRNTKLMKTLLKDIPSLANKPNQDGKTAHELANAEGKTLLEDYVEIELTPKDIFKLYEQGDKEALLKVTSKDPRALDIMVGPAGNETLLTHAIKNNNADMIAFLAEHAGYLAEKPNTNDKKTPIQLAVKKEIDALIESIKTGEKNRTPEALRPFRILLASPNIDPVAIFKMIEAPAGLVMDKGAKKQLEMITQFKVELGDLRRQVYEHGLKPRGLHNISTISTQQQIINSNLIKYVQLKHKTEFGFLPPDALAVVGQDIIKGSCNGLAWMHRTLDALGNEEEFYNKLRTIADWDGTYTHRTPPIKPADDASEREKEKYRVAMEAFKNTPEVIMDETLQSLLFAQHSGGEFNEFLDAIDASPEDQEAMLRNSGQASVDIGNLLLPSDCGFEFVPGYQEKEFKTHSKEELAQKINENVKEGTRVALDGYFARRQRHSVDLSIKHDSNGNTIYRLYDPNQPQNHTQEFNSIDDFYNALYQVFDEKDLDVPLKLKINTYEPEPVANKLTASGEDITKGSKQSVLSEKKSNVAFSETKPDKSEPMVEEPKVSEPKPSGPTP